MNASRFAATVLFLVAASAGRATENEPASPFITTPPEVVERMLRLANTGPDDLVIDLGSGDGRIVITAARAFGARGLGIELDAGLVEKSWQNARAAKVAERVAFVNDDVLRADISKATVVTVYLLPGLINKLQPRFLDELQPGTRVVSHAFSMIGWKPDRVESMRVSGPHPGQVDQSTLYLWIVPAEVRGQWTALAPGGAWRLTFHQNYQELELEALVGGKTLPGRASLSGRHLAISLPEGDYRGRVEAGRIVGELTAGGRTTPVVLTRVP